VKHAGALALNRLEDLLKKLRKRERLKEKKRGVFYRGASAFLHFHEDPAGLFADVRTATGWDRLPVNSRTEKQALLSEVDKALE
jgi:hypothetical protein